MTWQKFMAYAHTNVEIKPVFGVDFTPEKPIVAQAEPTAPATPVEERPPGLKPAAADKLLEVADLLGETLRTLQGASGGATLVVSQSTPGN